MELVDEIRWLREALQDLEDRVINWVSRPRVYTSLREAFEHTATDIMLARTLLDIAAYREELARIERVVKDAWG
ncbi:hypothetical protein [Alphaspiravirus yamagawaense]|uniref:Uncharacterized protein n=1 Tax=Alphaspiravirus yamagawaense TaxID=1157339 RepID=J7Q7J6_9VIRU|nr:hypothetical protein [Aeropyrum coil-shaped virus]CCG27847.1 hypothetical protein [Aeropyrum coil-shaped virus]